MTCIEIEVAVANHWGYRDNVIVPNISFGMGVHECDLFILTKARYAIEIEIKVSKADLKKDAKKDHAHNSKKISSLFFAIPKSLEPHIEFIPNHAGIIICEKIDGDVFAKVIRQAETKSHVEKLTDKEVINLGRLGAMRIWNLKKKIIEQKAKIKALEAK